MTLLDAAGHAILPAEQQLCPECKAKPSQRSTEKMFGGYWKIICRQCGHQFASGQGEPDEEET